MLRIYFLRQWYGLSDEGLEDATTLLKFRRFFRSHRLHFDVGMALSGTVRIPALVDDNA
ncbi:Na+/H+ antiporter NhaB [Paraburkholderia sp. GAS41]